MIKVDFLIKFQENSMKKTRFFSTKFSSLKAQISLFLTLFSLISSQNITKIITRDILITNFGCFFNETQPFEACYDNLLEAFQSEAKILKNDIEIALNFMIKPGKHYILKDFLEISQIELFRKKSVKIQIKPLFFNSSVEIYVKTNEFYIFIAKSLILEDLTFIGEDLEVEKPGFFNENGNFRDKCANLKEKCCVDHRNIKDFRCFLQGKIIEKRGAISKGFYGLFNLEGIYDKTVIFVIKNCVFSGFQAIYHEKGWGSLIVLFSGEIVINNSVFKQCFFPNSIIFYAFSEDFLMENTINIMINRSIFEDYNEYKIIDKNTIAIFQFTGLSGKIMIENSLFQRIFHAKNLLFFEGNEGNLAFSNNSFENIEEMGIFVINSARNFSGFFNRFSAILKGFINISDVSETVVFQRLFLTNCHEFSIFLLFTNGEIRDSFFNDISLKKPLFSMENSNSSFFNSTFSKIICEEISVFSIKSSNFSSFSFNFFFEITKANTIFYAFSLNFFFFYENFLQNVTVYSIFSLKSLIFSENIGFFLQNSTIFNVWSNDHLCIKTYIMNSLIQFNKISSRIIRYILSKNYYFIVKNLHILDNFFTSISMISMLGTTNFSDFTVIRNHFLDSMLFQYVFDMMNSVIFVNNSLFEDNGIIEKKLFYLTKDNNILVSLWTMDLSMFSNSVFIIGKTIEMVSGFIEAMPLVGFFWAFNNTFLIKSSNENFGYKGILLDNFRTAVFVNNSFRNLLCNNQDFHHSHGGVLLAANPSLNYKKNDFSVIMIENSFYNCSCLYGGALAIISIAEVFLKNNRFFNTISKFYGGHLMIVSGENLVISGILLENSIADEGSGLFLQGFLQVFIEGLMIKNAVSRGNGGIYAKNLRFLQISNSKGNRLFSEKNGGFLYLYKTMAFLNNIVIEETSAFLEGGAIFVQGNSSLFLRNSIINNTFSRIGGGLSIENAKEISIISCVFFKAFSEEKGAVIFTDVLVGFLMENSSFIECFTEGNGGFFIKTEDETAVFIISRFSCIRTFARKGSCIYYVSASEFVIKDLIIQENGRFPMFLQWSFPIFLNFSNVIIKDNFLAENLVFLQGFIVDFDSFFFRNNTANFLVNLQGVTGRFSKVFSENNEGLFLINLFDSFMDFKGLSLLNDLKKPYDLSAFHAVFSMVNIEEFLLNDGFSKKGVFFESREGNLLIKASKFFNNTGQIFRNSKNNISINSSFFKENVNIEGFKDFPNELHFENGDKCCFSIKIEFSQFEVSSGFSIKSLGFNEISIENSRFFCKGIHCFSIFYLYNNEKVSKIAIFFSNFSNNSAKIGSSLYFLGNFAVNISFSSFSSNKALINSSEIALNPLQGLAPCVFFKPFQEKLAIIGIYSSKFYDNYAAFIAGTVFSQIAVKSFNNTFRNNSDSFNFSTIFYSYPLFLQRENVEISMKNWDISKKNDDSTIINIVSGVPFTIKFSIIDNFGQKLIFDSKTFAVLKPNPTIFSYSSSISIENGLTQAKNGFFSFENLLIKALPNFSFFLIITANFAGISNNIHNELNAFLMKKTLHFFTRKCIKGEILLIDFSCFFCPEGFYSLKDPMIKGLKYQKCHICPLNCFCYGGIYITPLSGFFRKDFSSQNAVKCMSFEACLGVPLLKIAENFITNFSEIHASGFCKEGNHNTLCFYCEKGYGRYENRDFCKRCESLGLKVYVRFCLYFLLMVSYILINCYFAESRNLLKKSPFTNFSTFMKILINHCQYIAIISSQIDFPLRNFGDLFNISNYLSFSQDYIITNDCVLQQIYHQKETVIIFKGVFNTILPFIFSGFSFVIWLIFNTILGKCHCFSKNLQKIPRNFKAISNKILLFIVLSTFIFYSLIVKSNFGLFQCMIIDKNDDKTFLRQSPDLECWEKPHLNYVFFIGIPGLLLWGLIFPLVLYWILRRNSLIIAKYDKNINNSLEKLTISPLKESSVFPLQNKLNLSFIPNFSSNVNIISEESREIPLQKPNFSNSNSEIPLKNRRNFYNNEIPLKNRTNFSNNNIEIPLKNRTNFSNSNIEIPLKNSINFEIPLKKPNISNINIEIPLKTKPNTPNNELHYKTRVIPLKNKIKLNFAPNFSNFDLETMQNIEESRIFVFFYKDFKPNFFYWECMIFFRKFILTFLVAMIDTIPYELINILMNIVVFLSILLTSKRFPYQLKLANYAELSSLSAISITIFSALVFESTNCGENTKIVIAIACLVGNVGFFTFLLGCLVKDSWKRYRDLNRNKEKIMRVLARKMYRISKIKFKKKKETLEKLESSLNFIG